MVTKIWLQWKWLLAPHQWKWPLVKTEKWLQAA